MFPQHVSSKFRGFRPGRKPLAQNGIGARWILGRLAKAMPLTSVPWPWLVWNVKGMCWNHNSLIVPIYGSMPVNPSKKGWLFAKVKHFRFFIILTLLLLIIFVLQKLFPLALHSYDSTGLRSLSQKSMSERLCCHRVDEMVCMQALLLGQANQAPRKLFVHCIWRMKPSIFCKRPEMYFKWECCQRFRCVWH